MNIKTSKRVCSVLNVIIPLFFSFMIGAIFASIAGYNPLVVYSTIFKSSFGSYGGIMQSLGFATPLPLRPVSGIWVWKASCTLALWRPPW